MEVPRLLARVEVAMHLAETFAFDVGIDLGGADAGMAEEFLDDAQIGAVFEEVSGEAMPQHVRGDISANPGSPGALLDPQPERDGGKRPPARAQEHVCR